MVNMYEHLGMGYQGNKIGRLNVITF